MTDRRLFSRPQLLWSRERDEEHQEATAKNPDQLAIDRLVQFSLEDSKLLPSNQQRPTA